MSGFRFTPREEVIMINRVLRDDPTKGDMHNRQSIGASGFMKSLMDYDLWPLYLVRHITVCGEAWSCDANYFLIGWSYGLHTNESTNQLSHFDIERSWIRCSTEQSYDNCMLNTFLELDLSAFVLTI